MLNCSVLLALVYAPILDYNTLPWLELLFLTAATLMSYWAGHVLLALTELSLSEVIGEGRNMRLLPASEEQRSTVLDIPTLIGHNSTGSWPYALALYFSLLVVVNMTLMCCILLMSYIESLLYRLAVLMLISMLASVVNLCSVERLEKLEIVLAGVRMVFMLLMVFLVYTNSVELAYFFLSQPLWLLNYHVCSPLFLPNQSPNSQKQIHNTTLAISAGFCIVLVFASYNSTDIEIPYDYEVLLQCLFFVLFLSTVSIYLRTFSHMLCSWRYGCNPKEIETRHSKRMKLIKIFSPWFVFLINALVGIVFFGEEFRALTLLEILSPIINGLIATVVLYWILASTYEQQISQLGLQGRAVSKWATGALKWIPALITAGGVTEMTFLPGFYMSDLIQPRLLMPLGVDLVLFGALVLWKRLGR